MVALCTFPKVLKCILDGELFHLCSELLMVLLLRCFGWCPPPLITWPCTRTGSCRGSRATSSWETELMDAREWSLSKDTPSSSHLVCWQGCCEADSRNRLAATSPNISFIMIQLIQFFAPERRLFVFSS